MSDELPGFSSAGRQSDRQPDEKRGTGGAGAGGTGAGAGGVDGHAVGGSGAGAGGADAGGVHAGGTDAGGVDAVRAALNRARAAARAKPAVNPAKRRRPQPARSSGAGPDARDPQPFGSSIRRLVAERGWDTSVAVGGVMGRWDAVVGPDLAGHCRPQSFEDGVLTVVAESTAWATQVRLLVPTVFRRLAEEVGEGTVTKIVVQGPQAPSWRRGSWVAPGSQGPRDTYG